MKFTNRAHITNVGASTLIVGGTFYGIEGGIYSNDRLLLTLEARLSTVGTCTELSGHI